MRVRRVRVLAQGIGEQSLRLALDAPGFGRQGHRFGIFDLDVEIVRSQQAHLQQRVAGIAELLQLLVAAREQAQALDIVRLSCQSLFETGDRSSQVRRARHFRLGRDQRLRIERARLPDLAILQKRRQRYQHHEEQGEQARRPLRRCGGRGQCGPLGLVFVLGQHAGRTCGGECIALLAGRARVFVLNLRAQQRPQDRRHGRDADQRDPDQECSAHRSTLSSIGPGRSGCGPARSIMLRAIATPISRIRIGPTHNTSVVALNGGRYSTKSP